MPDHTCTKCKETKPATTEFFYRNSAYKSGFKSWCKDCVNKQYQANHEKNAQRKLKYRRDNPEKVSQIDRKYRENNREKVIQAKKKWAQNNPERLKEAARKRETLKRLNGQSPYSEAEVLSLHGPNCHICNQPIDLDAPRQCGLPGWELGLQMDHVISISKGGPDTLENVKPAHGLCNSRKGSKV
jgi:5-methylcytosine-specific restriction endonuclease McrA